MVLKLVYPAVLKGNMDQENKLPLLFRFYFPDSAPSAQKGAPGASKSGAAPSRGGSLSASCITLKIRFNAQ